jgi:hypothetical protein
MPTNQTYIDMMEKLVRQQNKQLLRIIAKNEDLDYKTLVAKYLGK